MGADGHWLLMKREDWERRYPGIRPEEFDIWEVTVLGVDAICRYWDTEGKGDWTDNESEQAKWFLKHAEDHTVWT